MRRIIAFVGAACLLTGISLFPAPSHTFAAHQLKKSFVVGLVLDVGGINDKSFNHLAFLGMASAERKFPSVKGSYLVSGAQSDYVPNLTHYASSSNLTIGNGFDMEAAMYIVAKQYPNRKFAFVDGEPADAKGNPRPLKNVANLFFREQESGYLVGVIAGLMEKEHIGKAKHNVIGWMGGQSIPPVNHYIAGYIAGAKKVNPSVKILGGYTNSFTDQGKGKGIGLQHISQGADILFQVAGASGLGYLAAAQQKGVYGIGVDADQGYLGKHIITSALKKVDTAVRLTIRDTLKGHFRGGDHFFDLKNHATGFAKPNSVVPKSIVATANRYEKLIASGKIVPPNVIH